jgi:hypothetical protein
MMRPKDVALVAFRLLAIWTVVSGLDLLLQTLASWRVVYAQAMAAMPNVPNVPTSSEFLWMTASALLARVLLGLVLWWTSPFLARVTCPGEAPLVGVISREGLYSAATFLVGIWLVSDSLPGLAYFGFAATRPGTPAYPDVNRPAQIAQLVARFVIGLTFLRGGWLVRWALEGPIVRAPGVRVDGGVEQEDEADER